MLNPRSTTNGHSIYRPDPISHIDEDDVYRLQRLYHLDEQDKYKNHFESERLSNTQAQRSFLSSSPFIKAHIHETK